MMVSIKNLSIDGEPYEAKVILGSLKDGQIEVRAEYGQCTFNLGASGKWFDKFAENEYRYEITEGAPKVEPSALMELIGNIPDGEWSKISAMANEDIKNTFNHIAPVNKAQVIRCLYAFERYCYTRENGLIKSEPPAKLTEQVPEPFEYEAGVTRVKSGGVEGVVQSVDGPIAYVIFDKSDGIPELISSPVLIRKLTRI